MMKYNPRYVIIVYDTVQIGRYMKNRVILFTVIFYLILSVAGIPAQSRIPKESGNWLASSNSGTA